MYLSCLLIDVGTNPDRPRPGRLWLHNRYRVHQRLCMAFPSKNRKDDDRHFLKPYAPADFPEDRSSADRGVADVSVEKLPHVHAKRDDHSGFLFRIDPRGGGRVPILVLSALKPDWDYAFGLKPGQLDPRTKRPIGNAGHLLAAPPTEPRPVQLTIEAGGRFRFSLAANPVFRAREESVDRRGNRLNARWVGKRVPVPGDEASLRNWLERRALRAGFVLKELTLIQCGYVYLNKAGEAASGHRLRSVRYEGVLEVSDPDKFRDALATGIGPAKAFGFGLLSVAPVGGEDSHSGEPS